MTSVAVLGAGAGGLATVVELAQAGHEVTLWHPNAGTLQPYRDGKVTFTGVLGEGVVVARAATNDLAGALVGAAAVIVSLPALLHPSLFAELAHQGVPAPVALSPGATGGALHLRQVFRRAGARLPPVVELSTLPYVARSLPTGGVNITGVARQLRAGVLPGGEEAAIMAGSLLSSQLLLTDVLGSSLANVNLVLHPPGAVLSAAWVEATGGRFTFYVEGLTPGVARVLEALDFERRAVAREFGHELPSLVEEMAMIGTVPAAAVGGVHPPGEATAASIRAGEANRAVPAPGSLSHRYYKEDFAFGLQPFLALARVAGTGAPMAESLLALGRALLGPEMPPGLGAGDLGIAGVSAATLVKELRP